MRTDDKVPGGSVVQLARQLLPRGGVLPEEVWHRRQRGMLVLLWLHVPAVAVFALARQASVWHSAQEAGFVAAFAVLASVSRNRRVSTVLTALGLLTSSAVFVHLSGGVIEFHFHFFVMVGVITLYQDWWPFLVAIGYVVLQHGVAGALMPESVYNHPAAVANPWKWAAVHGLFILGMSAAGILAWRLNEAAMGALRDREHQLAEAQNVARLGSWEWDMATDRVTWSDELYRVFAVDRDELIPTYEGILDRVHPEDRPALQRAVERTVSTREPFALDFRTVPDGATVRWLHARGHLVTGEDGRPARMAGTAQDVTERKRAEDALRSSEARYRRIIETTQEGVLMTDNSGVATFVNERMAEMLGRTVEEIVGQPMTSFMDGESARSWADGGQARTTGGEGHVDYKFIRRNGSELWALLSTSPVRDDQGRPLGTLAMVSDITDRKRAEHLLSHQALHDPLTGLPNRALLLDRLEHALRRSDGTGGRLAVLFLDIDRFKVINDSLGHRPGDELIATIGERLSARARATDTVARFGGDEFVVLIEDVTDERDAAGFAEDIAAAVSRPVVLEGRSVMVTASIGIALTNGHPHTAEELLRDADAAMYRAKEKGRSRYEIFDTDMRTRVVERLETEAALRQALSRGEFRLVFQPEISLQDGSTVGVEALVRWDHPERGLIGPAGFITVAEETGLIVPIGTWVLTEACQQLKSWQSTHPELESLVVWVNLSVRQLAEPELVDMVAWIIEEAGISPSCLGLEITESVFSEDLDAVRSVLARLKDVGVRLAVDDFGTGFSSLSYLKSFPVDVLKVDRSFVSGLGNDPGDSAIVAAIIGLARSLGLDAIAEGVETFDQLSSLHGLDCDRAQGYFFSKPVPAQEMEAMLVRRAADRRDLLRRGPARPPRASSRMSVLVCDDDATTRWVYVDAFEGAGAKVAEAADGSECLAIAARTQPDLIVLDLVMPNRDGFAVLEELRTRAPQSKVLMVTAFAGGEVAERSRRLGAHACLEKLEFLGHIDEVAEQLTEELEPAS